MAAVCDLLLVAVLADDLRCFFLCTTDAKLRLAICEFSPHDILADTVERTIAHCQKVYMLHALLDEVKVANPNQYASFAPKLRI